MLTKDQAFDIGEFIYKNGHKSLWQVGDRLEKILGEFAINPNKEQIISAFIVKNGAEKIYTLDNAIFKLIQELAKAEQPVELTMS